MISVDMPLKMRSVVLFSVFLTGAMAANWPTWRGPKGDGSSTETGLPTKWSQTENVTWKLAMPDVTGSTPVIWGDTIFMNTADQGSVWLQEIGRAQV